MNKPTVRYTGEPLIILGRAIVTPIDHPNPHGLVSNTGPVTTSQLISGPDEEGKFETQNTIYIPE